MKCIDTGQEDIVLSTLMTEGICFKLNASLTSEIFVRILKTLYSSINVLNIQYFLVKCCKVTPVCNSNTRVLNSLQWSSIVVQQVLQLTGPFTFSFGPVRCQTYCIQLECGCPFGPTGEEEEE